MRRHSLCVAAVAATFAAIALSVPALHADGPPSSPVITGKAAFTDFDFPGEASAAFNSALINNQGVTAGYYATPTGFVAGYERSPEGRMTTFVPAASESCSSISDKCRCSGTP